MQALLSVETRGVSPEQAWAAAVDTVENQIG